MSHVVTMVRLAARAWIVIGFLAAASSWAAEPSLVIGFERFGKHEEISELQAGRLLVNELNCTACHASQQQWVSAKGAPDLSGVGLRLQPEWIRRYLSDPATLDPGTTMPDVMRHLSTDEKADAVEALTAFLSTQRMPFTVLKAGGALPVVHEFYNRGDASSGKRLYHTIGCVACHRPDDDYDAPDTVPSAVDALIEQLDPEELEEMGLAGVARPVESIPHGDLPSKFTRQSLAMFLIDPARTRPSGRMPNLRLSPAEAADITAYLMGEALVLSSEQLELATDSSLIERGKRWFERLRCAQCHNATDVEADFASIPLDEIDLTAEASCLQNPRDDMPRYELEDTHRNAMRNCLTAVDREVIDEASLVQSRLLQLNCFGCHSRAVDEEGPALGGIGRFRKPYFETVDHVDLGDEGRLPPPLTGVGRKLQSSALRSVFAEKTEPHRPYMTIRMPAYHQELIQPLLDLLPSVDQVDRRNAEQVFGKPNDLVDAGRALTDTGCVQCHLFGGQALPGVVGIDLKGMTRRVHPTWFHSFVFNPGEVKSRTRMPTFFPDGKSNQPQLLDGDVDLQIASLWHYLDQLDSQPLPEQIAKIRSANYELIPSERPLVLRTFMEQAGTHAIAVGFPAGVHYAFDAESCHLALGWKEKFIDARTTWFERFTPPVAPLGSAVVPMQLDKSFYLAPPRHGIEWDFPKPTFLGYQLDSGGVPTMMYRIGPWRIEDRIEATENQTLVRTMRIETVDIEDAEKRLGDGKRLMWVAQSGESIEPVSPKSFVNSDGVTVGVSGLKHIGQLQNYNGQNQWAIEINPPETATVEYQW